MKTFLGKLGLIALAALTPVALHAQQARSIAYGRTTITFAPALGQTLGGAGVVVSDLAGMPLQNGVLNLTTVDGVIDLNTALGDFVFTGGFQLSAAGQTVRVQNLAMETSNPTSSVITGQVVYNGTVIGPRQAIFAVNAIPAATLPLAPQNGTLTLNGLSLGLSAGFVNLINGAAHQTVISTATQVGAANIYAVLSATN